MEKQLNRRRIQDYCLLIILIAFSIWGGLVTLGCFGPGAVPGCALSGETRDPETGEETGGTPYSKAGIAFDINNTNIRGALYSVPRYADTGEEGSQPEYTWLVNPYDGRIAGPDPADPENRLLIMIYKDESRPRDVKLKASYRTPNGYDREAFKTVRVVNKYY